MMTHITDVVDTCLISFNLFIIYLTLKKYNICFKLNKLYTIIWSCILIVSGVRDWKIKDKGKIWEGNVKMKVYIGVLCMVSSDWVCSRG